jgi:ABC-type sugar transport system substrate-binding protein
MKPNKLSVITFFALFLLMITGCGPASTTAAPATLSPTKVASATQAMIIEPTEVSVATPLPTPTETPPIPCMIAFDSDRDGNREVYVMGPDGKDPYNVSNNPGDDFEPSWSPDSSRITFVSNRATDGESGQFVYVVNADGSDVRQLSHENWSVQPDWSHDGRLIVYSGNDDIRVIPADGSGGSVNLTNSPEKDWQPSWSPDGSKIAWLSGMDGKWNIFVMNADGSEVKQLTDNGKALDVIWTIDGEIFSHWDQPEGVCQKCVMAADGSNARDAGGKGELQRFMPFRTVDGDRVECVSGDLIPGNDEVYLVGEIYPDIFFNLTNNPGLDRNPDWPANCLAGFEGATQAAAAAPETAPTNTPTGLVIGYAGDNEWQRQRKEDFQKACDELGIECVYGELPELIERGVSVVVQNSDPISVNGLHEDILKARDKGIPVFLLDAESITDGAYSITIDHYKWAKTSLGWLLEKIGGQGEIAYFDLHPFHRYGELISSLLADYPGIKVVEFRDGKYDSGKIKPESSDFLRAHPELKGLWTSFNMSEAIRGLKENGFPYEEWPALVCDATQEGLDTWQVAKSEYPGFDCFAVVNPPGIAYDAAYAAYYLVNGAQIDESVLGGEFGHSLYVDFPEVTNTNMKEWLKRARAEHWDMLDELMSPEEIKEKWFME